MKNSRNELLGKSRDLAGYQDDDHKARSTTRSSTGSIRALLITRGNFPAGRGSSRRNLRTDLEIINDLSEYNRLHFPRLLRTLWAGNGRTKESGMKIQAGPQQSICDLTRN